jgi:hypothetical protein
MENNLFHLNAGFAALWLNGFAGETLIFVTLATKSRFQDNIFQGCPRISFQNVKESKNVL